MKMYLDRAVGIDLGTTNSSCAYASLDGSRVVLAADQHGRTVVPSVVAYVPEKEALCCGFSAWNRRGMQPEPVASVKRKMGGSQALRLGPQECLPEEVSAKVLETVVEQMRSHLHREDPDGEAWPGHSHRITRAVVTVPAYFDAPQIEATRRAGEICGLELLALLQEPTAASMYCAWKRGLSDGLFLVYDLGGGTFDVSVIRCVLGEYQVVAIDGDNYLGGDDFDRRLAEWLRQQLAERGFALALKVLESPEDATRFELLTRVARSIKESLSTQEVCYVAHRDLFQDQRGQWVSFELEVGRNTFTGLIEDMVEATVVACERALQRAEEVAGVSLADVDHVLLVGGSTRIPLVQQRVRAAFCGEGKAKATDLTVESPDTCVALGAALHAANLGGLLVGQETSALAVHLHSPLATTRAQTHVVGEVVGEGAAAIQTVLLLDEGGATQQVGEVEGRRFRLREIALPDVGLYRWGLELLDGRGSKEGNYGLTLVRSEALRRSGSALSNPTVLAKTLYLEVVRNGELQRRPLLERGRSLPAKERFRFQTADQSGVVLLTVLQNRFPISTLHLEVSKTLPVGSPVVLELEVDAQMRMSASGEVAGQTFWVAVQPPARGEDLEWEEIEGLMAEAEALGGALWGHEAAMYRRECPFLLASIREAARTDPDKLRALVQRLEEMLEVLRGRGGALSPGYDRFQVVLDRVRRLAFRQEAALGLTFSEWQERLGGLEKEAESVYRAANHRGWAKVYAQVQALFESLSQDEGRFVVVNSLEHIQDLFASACHWVNILQDKVDQVVLPSHPETRAFRREALAEIVAAMEAEVVRPVEAQRGQLQEGSEQRAQLERIIAAARSLDRRLAQVHGLGVVAESE